MWQGRSQWGGRGADCPPGHQKSGRRAKIGKGKKGERKEKREKGREKRKGKEEEREREKEREKEKGKKREKGKERKREEKKGEKGRKGGEELFVHTYEPQNLLEILKVYLCVSCHPLSLKHLGQGLS